MLADAGAPVLLTRTALREHLPAHDAHVVCLDADWPGISGSRLCGEKMLIGGN